MKRPGLETITASKLAVTIMPAAEFVVPDIVPVGLTLLGGRPKMGKSWLALNIAIAVSLGIPVLGRRPRAAEVLYLGLEDGTRRLQGRILSILGEVPSPDALHIGEKCPPLDEGGDAMLRAWVREHPAARLIIVDIFTRIRPKAKAGSSLYEADYAAAQPLRMLANEFGLAVIAIVHAGKRDARHVEGDPLDALSATTGLAGAADAVLMLDTRRGSKALFGRGRDIPDIEMTVALSPEGRISEVDDPERADRSPAQNAILGALNSYGAALGPSRIAELAGLSENVVKQRLRTLLKSGKVAKDGRGTYRLCLHPSIITSVTAHTNSLNKNNKLGVSKKVTSTMKSVTSDDHPVTSGFRKAG